MGGRAGGSGLSMRSRAGGMPVGGRGERPGKAAAVLAGTEGRRATSFSSFRAPSSGQEASPERA